ncbi:MAG: hypothetical protein ABIH20_06355 [Candidatus Diapherotrites archaeon]
MEKESIFNSLKKQVKKPGQSDSVNTESSIYPDNSQKQTTTESAPDKSRASLFGRQTSPEQNPKSVPPKPKSEGKGLFGFLKQKPKSESDSKQTVGAAFGSKPYSMRKDLGTQPHERNSDKTDEIISKIGFGYDEKFTQNDPLEEKPEPVEPEPIPEPIPPKPVQRPEPKPEPFKPAKFKVQQEPKPIPEKSSVDESFSSKKEPIVQKVAQKNNVAPSEWQEETASSLAKEILDSRVNKKVEYKQKESNALNIVVLLLIIIGVVVLAGIWYFYLGAVIE